MAYEPPLTWLALPVLVPETMIVPDVRTLPGATSVTAPKVKAFGSSVAATVVTLNGALTAPGPMPMVSIAVVVEATLAEADLRTVTDSPLLQLQESVVKYQRSEVLRGGNES